MGKILNPEKFPDNASRERNLESILDSMPSLVAFIGKDLRYQYINNAYEHWFNIDRKWVIGKHVAEVLGQKAHEKLLSYLDKVLNGTPVNFTMDVPYVYGERSVDATYTPHFDEHGNVDGFTVLVNDVTRQRQMEKELDRTRAMEALQKRDEFFSRMIDVISDYAIIFLDTKGYIQNWNKGAEKIKGYTKEEILGKHFSILYVPEDRSQNVPQKHLNEAMENGKAAMEGWRQRKDGSVFWGGITITALYDQQKNLEGFSKVTRDLTERKLAEDKMRQYAQQLEYKNKELEQFAYVASHDLQEPLRKIKTFNERILQLENLSEQGREYFNRAISAASRMQVLITDLLTYSRTTNDPQTFELVDLNNVLNEIITLRKESIHEHHVTIEVPPLPVLFAIPFQLRQLFDNLISNAIKYRNPQRNPVIQISSEVISGKQLDEEHVEKFKDYYHISVADNGIGFEPEYNEKIFEIFQRLHGLGTMPGSGIGLAICKKIVKIHQGFIRARGKASEGATFHVYLPVQ